MLSTNNLIVVLMGYLFTQVLVAFIIYVLLSKASHRQLKALFVGAGRDYYTIGFEQAARESLNSVINEMHNSNMKMAERTAASVADRAETTAAELAKLTKKTADELKVSTSLLTTVLTAKVDDIQDSVHVNYAAVQNLQKNLTAFIESYNAKP